MLIQALCDYYEVLAAKGALTPEGWSRVETTFLVSLTPAGRIDGIADWRIREYTTDKKGKPREQLTRRAILLPKRSEKPGIDSSIIEHRPLSLFGLNYDKSTGKLSPDDATSKAKKSRRVFEEKNLEFLEGLNSPVINAFRAFIETWRAEDERENEYLLTLGKEYPGAYYAFCLSGRPDLLLHEDAQLSAKWNAAYAVSAAPDAPTAQCCITGRTEPIARLHDKLKGFPNPGTGGNILVCFNNASEYSYGHEQSYNSNISESAMRKYTAALNHLLADKRHKDNLDDVCVLHWAASGEEQYDELTALLTFGDTLDAELTDALLKSVYSRARDGWSGAADIEGIGMIDPSVDYYIAGFKTNSSRVAVKFIYRQSFGGLLENLAQHQRDMALREEARPIWVSALKKELISPKSKNQTIDPSLLSGLMDAIVNGGRYPRFLLTETIRRVKTDSDEEKNTFIKLNDVRVGIIKACINRELRLSGKEEEIKMSLDKQNSNPAYLCGRLFAVLENIQLKSANYNLNRTIRDAYFASAMARPASVFPKLMSLSMYHMKKLDNPKYFEDAKREIVDMLGTEFPQSQGTTEQGKFIIGYYQQKQYEYDSMKKYQEEKKNDDQ